ncbi:unnamed protein product, partial [Prorocentrum cordatum]
VLAIALGVMVADRVIMECFPDQPQQAGPAGPGGEAAGAAGAPRGEDAAGEPWSQQAAVYAVCLAFGYLSFMALRGPPRAAAPKRPPSAPLAKASAPRGA